MSARPFVILCLGSAAALAHASGTPDLSPCLDLSAKSERAICLDPRLQALPRTVKAIRSLASLLPDRAPVLVEVLDHLEGTGHTAGDPALEVERLDLRGQALHSLGRFEEAAATYVRAVEIDDGTTRLTWTRGGETAWTAELDPGGGRLERAAASLQAAGERETARTLLARALRLGAAGSAREAWEETGGGAVPGLLDSPEILSPTPPRQFVPELDVQRFDGDPISLRALRGKVVILDFWATWCQPCSEELPHLQALYTAERDRGLEALAINQLETEELAVPYARSMGLTMPIGKYDRALDEVFRVNALPTLIVVDRLGRLRGRWDGYKKGVETRVADLVRRLLVDDSDDRWVLAEVVEGAGRLDVAWMREGPSPIEGLTILPAGSGPARIVAGFHSHLVQFDPENGEVVVTRRVETGTGRVRRVELDGNGGEGVVIFRPGSRRLALHDSDCERLAEWNAPAAVLDVTSTPASEESAGRVVLGTVGGLIHSDPWGRDVQTIDWDGEVTDVEPGASGGVIALDAAGRVSWLGPELGVERRWNGPATSWTLAAGSASGEDVGVAPFRVGSAVTGSFLAEGGIQVALAVGSSQLVVLDAESGAVRFRALWPELLHLAASDLDGDGRDELVVASGSRISVIRAGRDSLVD